MSQESIPPKRAYTAAHGCVYAFEQQVDGHLSILPYQGDPDPSPIGLFIDAPAVRHNRVRRPAIREGWLNWRTGRAQAGGESGEGEVASAAVAPPMEPMVE